MQVTAPAAGLDSFGAIVFGWLKNNWWSIGCGGAFVGCFFEFHMSKWGRATFLTFLCTRFWKKMGWNMKKPTPSYLESVSFIDSNLPWDKAFTVWYRCCHWNPMICQLSLASAGRFGESGAFGWRVCRSSNSIFFEISSTFWSAQNIIFVDF